MLINCNTNMCFVELMVSNTSLNIASSKNILLNMLILSNIIYSVTAQIDNKKRSFFFFSPYLVTVIGNNYFPFNILCKYKEIMKNKN